MVQVQPATPVRTLTYCGAGGRGWHAHGMPNQDDKTENPLRDNANQVSAQLTDEKAAIIYAAGLVANAIKLVGSQIAQIISQKR